MKLLIPLLSLILAHVVLAAEEPADLVELRQGWETQRGEAQAKVDELYFAELEELKKNYTKAGNLEAARAVDATIKGDNKEGEQPSPLTKLNQARERSLLKALKPLDKQYWQELKKLRGDFQKQGSLAGIEATDAEIEKVLAAYKKPEPPKAKSTRSSNDAEFPLDGIWVSEFKGATSSRAYKGERRVDSRCTITEFEVTQHDELIELHYSNGLMETFKYDARKPDVLEGHVSHKEQPDTLNPIRITRFKADKNAANTVMEGPWVDSRGRLLKICVGNRFIDDRGDVRGFNLVEQDDLLLFSFKRPPRTWEMRVSLDNPDVYQCRNNAGERFTLTRVKW